MTIFALEKASLALLLSGLSLITIGELPLVPGPRTDYFLRDWLPELLFRSVERLLFRPVKMLDVILA